MQNLDQILLESVKLILAGLIGGLIGARANDFFTRRREKEAGIALRQRELLAFLRAWQVEIDRRHLSTGGYQRQVRAFLDGLPRFNALAAAVQSDIPGDKAPTLETLIKALATYQTGQFQTEAGYRQLQEALAALLDFFNKK